MNLRHLFFVAGLALTSAATAACNVSSNTSAPSVDLSRITLEKITEEFVWEYNPNEEGMVGSFTFRVFDAQNRPVEGLDSTNFGFFEDGSPADVESASDAANLKLNISLILDGSDSIDKAGAAQAVRESAESMVFALHHKANFRFYSFANSSNQHALVDEWSTVGRFTSLYDAVHRAAEDSAARRDNAIIVVFTDGNDNHSERSLEDAVAALEENNILLYAIGLGDVDRTPLDRMAGVAGGDVALASGKESLKGVFDDIGRRLGGIYRVSYLSPARNGDHELRFVINTPQGGTAEHVSQFTVDPSRVMAGACTAGTSPVPGSPGLCCPLGSDQIPGTWACGTCPAGNSPVPGTSRCCPTGTTPIAGASMCSN